MELDHIGDILKVEILNFCNIFKIYLKLKVYARKWK